MFWVRTLNALHDGHLSSVNKCKLFSQPVDRFNNCLADLVKLEELRREDLTFLRNRSRQRLRYTCTTGS